MNNKSSLFHTALLVLVLVGCAGGPPHKISDENTSSDFAGQTYSNLLIVAAYPDRGTRVSIETTLAEELTARGVKATPSYNVLTDTSALADPVAVTNAIASGNHDSLLVVRTIDEAYEYDYGDYLETTGTVYLLGGEPGAATDVGALIAWAGEGLYTLYVGLWDGSAQKPAWQITTDSAVTESVSGDVSALVDLIVPRLREKGLL